MIVGLQRCGIAVGLQRCGIAVYAFLALDSYF